MNNNYNNINNIANNVRPIIRRNLAANVREAGGRQGRLTGYRKAAAPLTRLMNLAWGL